MSDAVKESKRYANGHELHICLHTSIRFGKTIKLKWTWYTLVKIGQNYIWGTVLNSDAEIVLHWRLSQTLFLSLSLSNPLTSVHPLPYRMLEETIINMIGSLHKRRWAIIGQAWQGASVTDFKCISPGTESVVVLTLRFEVL